ncbi:NADPH:quinone reductase [Streptococcus pluranimalium]
MKAAYIIETGTTDRIIWGDLADPKPKNGELLIEVEAVAINAVDTFIRSGIYQTQLPAPFILGRDAIGRVVAVGAEVQQFHIGDRVWTNSMGYNGRQGVTSQLAIIPENRAFLAPKRVDSYQLVGSVHAAATALLVVEEMMRLEASQWLLVEGAAGHVGTKLVQAAKAKGATIATTSHPRDFDLLRRLGARECFSYADKALGSQLRTLRPDGFDHIIDTSGKNALQDNLDLLAHHGAVTMITKPKEAIFNPQTFYMRSQSLRGFVISQVPLSQLQRVGEQLNQAFAKGELLEEQVRLLPMSEAALGHRLLEEKAEKKKLVLIAF